MQQDFKYQALSDVHFIAYTKQNADLQQFCCVYKTNPLLHFHLGQHLYYSAINLIHSLCYKNCNDEPNRYEQ